MGNDGGTIPTRSEIINFTSKQFQDSSKFKQATNKELNNSLLLNSFKYCKLSKEKLSKPIVSDYKGNLFNKESILEYLINKKKDKNEMNSLPYIENLNDVVELNIDLIENETGKRTEDKIKCPLTGLYLDLNNEILENMKLKLCYIVPCGCCMDQNILIELINLEKKKQKINNKESEIISMGCPVCNKTFESNNIVELNNSNHLVNKKLQDRLDRLIGLGLYHNLKKRKTKRKKRSLEDTVNNVKINDDVNHEINDKIIDENNNKIKDNSSVKINCIIGSKTNDNEHSHSNNKKVKIK